MPDLCLLSAVWKLLTLASSLDLTSSQSSKSKLFPGFYHLDLAAGCFSPVATPLWDTGEASGRGSARLCALESWCSSAGTYAWSLPYSIPCLGLPGET